MTGLDRMMEVAMQECRAASDHYGEMWVPGGQPSTGRGCAVDTKARILRMIQCSPWVERKWLLECSGVSKAVLDTYLGQLFTAGQITKKMREKEMTYSAFKPQETTERLV